MRSAIVFSVYVLVFSKQNYHKLSRSCSMAPLPPMAFYCPMFERPSLVMFCSGAKARAELRLSCRYAIGDAWNFDSQQLLVLLY